MHSVIKDTCTIRLFFLPLVVVARMAWYVISLASACTGCAAARSLLRTACNLQSIIGDTINTGAQSPRLDIDAAERRRPVRPRPHLSMEQRPPTDGCWVPAGTSEPRAAAGNGACRLVPLVRVLQPKHRHTNYCVVVLPRAAIFRLSFQSPRSTSSVLVDAGQRVAFQGIAIASENE